MELTAVESNIKLGEMTKTPAMAITFAMIAINHYFVDLLLALAGR
jgi:hypothetical protein